MDFLPALLLPLEQAMAGRPWAGPNWQRGWFAYMVVDIVPVSLGFIGQHFKIETFHIPDLKLLGSSRDLTTMGPSFCLNDSWWW